LVDIAGYAPRLVLGKHLRHVRVIRLLARVDIRERLAMPYMVEQWDDTDSHVEELIALTGDYRVARAAYEEAVKRRSGRTVTLRQKTRLLVDSRRKS
jgi:hypothetical protein